MNLASAAQAGMSNERNRRLFWTFLDQGFVSAGAFVCQIVLARLLTPHGYGVFTLIFSALLTLQMINATLLFHPMSVRIPVAGGEEKPGLLGASILLVMSMTLLLALPFGIGLVAFGLSDVAVPALAYLLIWQAQEAMRRCLFGSLRHRAAILGDLVTYVGAAALTLGIGLAFGISIAGALTIMAVCAGIGACLHARALTLAMPSICLSRAVARDYWQIGGLPSLGNGVLSHARLVVVPWGLAVYAGPAATAGLQAAVNIVNLSNPLILGLGNLIPQIVSGARAQGLAGAWRLARKYVLTAALPIIVYSLVVCLWPTEVLRLFYGDGSEYIGLELPLRLLIIAGLIGFFVEAVLGFLHGATMVGRAARVNFFGTLCILLLAFPAIMLFGITGGCMALLTANLVRLAIAQMMLSQAHGHPSPALA